MPWWARTTAPCGLFLASACAWFPVAARLPAWPAHALAILVGMAYAWTVLAGVAEFLARRYGLDLPGRPGRAA